MKTVIITGSAGNLGRVVTEKFVQSGYKVVATVTSMKRKNGLKKNANLEIQPLDASKEKMADEFVRWVVGKRKSIDAALLLIGGYAPGSIEDSGEEELQRMFTLNFSTAYYMVRPIFNLMMRQPQGGKIILMSAATALKEKGRYHHLAYALSKTLIVNLAKILNEEAHQKNVHCYVIAPTTIDTPQNRAAMPNADFSKWTQPEEIAEMMEYICSDRGSKVTDVIIKM